MTARAPVVDVDLTGTVFEEGAAELARSYAQAFVQVLQDQDGGQALLDELDELVEDVWNGQPEFAALLSEGISDPARREAVLGRVFEGRTNPLVLNVLKVLSRRNRLALVPLIAKTARALWDRLHYRIPVTVLSARPLEEDQRGRLLERLLKLIPGYTPVLREQVDPSLIGGLIVQIGDQRYDASVKHRLEKVRETLRAERFRHLRDHPDLIVD